MDVRANVNAHVTKRANTNVNALRMPMSTTVDAHNYYSATRKLARILLQCKNPQSNATPFTVMPWRSVHDEIGDFACILGAPMLQQPHALPAETLKLYAVAATNPHPTRPSLHPNSTPPNPIPFPVLHTKINGGGVTFIDRVCQRNHEQDAPPTPFPKTRDAYLEGDGYKDSI